MIDLEQIKLLETKVAKAIDYVERLNGENAALRAQEAELNKKLTDYQKRIDELEVLIVRFKEDQGRIEDGILSALNRLNQFEEAIGKSLTIGDKNTAKASSKSAAKAAKQAQAGGPLGEGEEKICFEIPENPGDLSDPLAETAGDGSSNGELEIF